MKSLLLCYAAISVVQAFPGMADLAKNLAARQQPDNSSQLLGDLVDKPDSSLSPTGSLIKKLLTGAENPEDFTTSYTSVPDIRSAACKADTCCVWKHIADEMKSKMVTRDGQCNGLARSCVRMGFHDAATWSLKTGPGGGADGSLVLARECYDRSVNRAMIPACIQMQMWYDRYRRYGVSMADLIQMGATVATVTCPLGPRIRSFVGRKDSNKPSPDNLLPSPFDSADSLISLFADKTISAGQLVALVGAHTTSRQVTTDPRRAGAPQDTTPGVWDVAFYGETLDPKAPRNLFKFQSDINLSKDPRTSATWQRFVAPRGQGPWNGAFSNAYIRMSLLGVYNINDLTECTKALPKPPQNPPPPPPPPTGFSSDGTSLTDV